jgi:hypothetical protein
VLAGHPELGGGAQPHVQRLESGEVVRIGDSRGDLHEWVVARSGHQITAPAVTANGTITSVASGLCLDAVGSGTANGPYGPNQASEATSADDYVFNTQIVAALRADMGL